MLRKTRNLRRSQSVSQVNNLSDDLLYTFSDDKRSHDDSETTRRAPKRHQRSRRRLPSLVGGLRLLRRRLTTPELSPVERRVRLASDRGAVRTAHSVSGAYRQTDRGSLLSDSSACSEESSDGRPYQGPRLCRARATVDYQPSPYDREALPFRYGDIIDVISMSPSGLWRGALYGRVGTFKFINVEVLEEVGQSAEEVTSLSSRPTTVTELLRQVNLLEYQHVFSLHGFDQVEDFIGLQSDQLSELSIIDPGHRRRLLAAARSLELSMPDGDDLDDDDVLCDYTQPLLSELIISSDRFDLWKLSDVLGDQKSADGSRLLSLSSNPVSTSIKTPETLNDTEEAQIKGLKTEHIAALESSFDTTRLSLNQASSSDSGNPTLEQSSSQPRLSDGEEVQDALLPKPTPEAVQNGISQSQAGELKAVEVSEIATTPCSPDGTEGTHFQDTAKQPHLTLHHPAVFKENMHMSHLDSGLAHVSQDDTGGIDLQMVDKCESSATLRNSESVIENKRILDAKKTVLEEGMQLPDPVCLMSDEQDKLLLDPENSVPMENTIPHLPLNTQFCESKDDSLVPCEPRDESSLGHNQNSECVEQNLNEQCGLENMPVSTGDGSSTSVTTEKRLFSQTNPKHLSSEKPKILVSISPMGVDSVETGSLCRKVAKIPLTQKRRDAQSRQEVSSTSKSISAVTYGMPKPVILVESDTVSNSGPDVVPGVISPVPFSISSFVKDKDNHPLVVSCCENETKGQIESVSVPEERTKFVSDISGRTGSATSQEDTALCAEVLNFNNSGIKFVLETAPRSRHASDSSKRTFLAARSVFEKT